MSTINTTVYIEPKSPSIPKRIAAFFIDLVIALLLFTGLAFIVGEACGYKANYELLQEKYVEYGILDFKEETNEYVFCDTSKEECVNNWVSFYDDEEATIYYDKSVELTTFILTVSVFVMCLATEFVVPLVLGDRQTIGMYLFKIGLVSTDGTKVEHKQLFMRFLFGKFILTTMIPLYGLVYAFYGMFYGIYALALVVIIWIIDIALSLFSEKKAGIADSIGSCYACDIETSMIFDTIEEINAIKGAEAAEKVKKERY